MAIETAMISPATTPDGTFAAQVKFAYAPDMLQRFQMALAATAEYVINQESSADANYADRASFARHIAVNPAYWANQLSSLIAVDPASVTTTATDQMILNRIWTIWPVISYKASTVSYPTTTI